MQFLTFVALLIVGLTAFLIPINANYLELTDSDTMYDPLNNYIDEEFDAQPEKRGCVRRGGNCDHRPKDCCFNSSCRCNLWGSNCRCQRVGLFQKWG